MADSLPMMVRLLLLWCLALPANAETPIRVFAAASLGAALQEAREDWPGLRVSAAGSGTIARQVVQGAPADVVILANTLWMDWLVDQGAAHQNTPVATNTLVLLAAPDAPEDPRHSTRALAIGDPRHVPAGRYAQQALTALGLWDTLMPRVIPTQDVRAAVTFVSRGEAGYAIAYGSDVTDDLRVITRFDPGLHDPILYPAAALTPQGTAFLTWLTGPMGQALLARHGFGPAP